MDSQCTFNQTNKAFIGQPLHKCHTCDTKEKDYCVCVACAKTCHKGHDLSDESFGVGYCDCGAGDLDVDCNIVEALPLSLSNSIANLRTCALREQIYGFPPAAIMQSIEMIAKSSRVNTWDITQDFVVVPYVPFKSSIIETYAAVFSPYEIKIIGVNFPVEFSDERDFKIINQLVFHKTHETISNLLTEPLLDNQSLYLITLWFDDEWVNHFDDISHECCSGKGRSTYHWLMTFMQHPPVNYFKTDLLHSIRLPYKSDYTAILTVPIKRNSRIDNMLKVLEYRNELEQHLLCQTPTLLTSGEIEIKLPSFDKKFEMDDPFDILRHAGLPESALGNCIKFKVNMQLKNTAIGTRVTAGITGIIEECACLYDGITWTGDQPFHFAIVSPTGLRILDAIIDMTD